MTLLDRFGLNGIRGQIAALVLTAIIATHLFIIATILLHRPDSPDPGGEQGRGQLAAAVAIVGATPAADRPQVQAAIARAFPQLDIKPLQPELAEPAGDPFPPDAHRLRHELGDGFRIFPLHDRPHEIGITLPDGAAIAARLPPERHQRPFWGGPWMTSLLFVVASLGLLGLWAARALSAPLSSFAEAAESFSLDGSGEALPERGPQEIRALARALNRMRHRITALIDDRTKMLAAISHDLRTPITRMRLRSEFIEDDNQRAQTLHDLDQMGSMLRAVLSFLRNDGKLAPLTLTDLAATMQLITDQFGDMGRKVSYDGPRHAMAEVRPDDLRRALTNLVENAVRFGAETVIRLRQTPDMVTIDVEDDGPGISDARKAGVLEPFVRGDDARNMDDASGFGLGLSIARAVVQAHGGTLSLNDRQPHGLIVHIELPAKAGPQQEMAVSARD
jgi:signal transduction histidine kinase